MRRVGPRWLAKLLIAAFLCAIYVAAGKLSLHLAFFNPSATAVWLPTGLSLAALMILGLDLWPAVLVGAFIVNYTTAGSAVTSAVIAGGNTLEAVLGAWLLIHFAGGRQCFYKTANVFKFAAIVAFAAFVSSTMGVSTLEIGHLASWRDYDPLWLTWWLGDVTGAVLLTPALVLWSNGMRHRWSVWSVLEFGTLLACVLLASEFIFGDRWRIFAMQYPMKFLCIPLLMWAAFRFGSGGAATANVLLATGAVFYTIHGPGLLSGGNPNESLVMLQGFTGISGLVSLAVAANVSELFESARHLREANAATERKVQERTRALELLTATLQEQAILLQLAYDAIIVRDVEGVIRFWNAGAERLYGWSKEEAVGKRRRPLLEIQSEASLEEPDRELFTAGAWEGELLHTTRDGRRLVIDSRQTLRRDVHGKPAEILEINRDRTAQKRAEESLRELSGQLLRLQDRERRLIGRELHDSVGQELAALKMFLGAIARAEGPYQQIADKVKECIGLVDSCTREVRTMSYLLYPPFLEELGLPSAIQNYLDGFRKSSGIQTKFEVSGDFNGLTDDVGLTLFRVLQEGLTNVHRHSGSSSAEVILAKDETNIRMEIKDQGKGMAPATGPSNDGPRLGVGLRGMRERVMQLGGNLRISSTERGTTITATVPCGHAFPLEDVDVTIAGS